MKIQMAEPNTKRSFWNKSLRTLLVISIYITLVTSIRYFLLDQSNNRAVLIERVHRLERARDLHLEKIHDLYLQFHESYTHLGIKVSRAAQQQ
jgi:hypothetical protein